MPLRRIVILVCFLLLTGTLAFAVMPPEHYEQMVENAEIKAIAVVEDVEIIENGKYYTTKIISFATQYALTESTPQSFTAFCKSVDTKEQESMVPEGGNRYFYPQKGERVFVKAARNGADLLYMKTVTPELENAIRTSPEKFR